MLRTVLVLSVICGLAQSSGIVQHGVAASGVVPVAAASAPVVTAASSQYFERIFNRLVIAPPVLEPAVPFAPAAAPPVFVEPVVKSVSVPFTPVPVAPVAPVAPVVPVNPTQNVPINPNVAIAVATAHAAAPVATILLPPYPFGAPSTVGFVPSTPPIVPSEEPKRESTTKPTTQVNVKTIAREPEPTTPLPLPSNSDNNFVQALPSNQNVNFKQYGPPLPPPLPQTRPQKLRTSVEVVPVPLTYIAPPPIKHEPIKAIKHIHTFVPMRAKLIIRPVSTPHIHIVRLPARLISYRVPVLTKNVGSRYPQNALRRLNKSRDTEPTTFRPFIRSNTKPPRI